MKDMYEVAMIGGVNNPCGDIDTFKARVAELEQVANLVLAATAADWRATTDDEADCAWGEAINAARSAMALDRAEPDGAKAASGEVVGNGESPSTSHVPARGPETGVLPRPSDALRCPENDGGAHCANCGAWLDAGRRALCTKAPEKLPHQDESCPDSAGPSNIRAEVGHGIIGRDSHELLLLGLPHYPYVIVDRNVPVAHADRIAKEITSAIQGTQEAAQRAETATRRNTKMKYSSGVVLKRSKE